MRFSLITIICALAAYAMAIAVPGAVDVVERDEDACVKTVRAFSSIDSIYEILIN
jgi:hypothetical protein